MVETAEGDKFPKSAQQSLNYINSIYVILLPLALVGLPRPVPADPLGPLQSLQRQLRGVPIMPVNLLPPNLFLPTLQPLMQVSQ